MTSLNVDARHDGSSHGLCLVTDLADPGQTFDALAGSDAVVHLAAIPAPEVRPTSETFRINTLSTYNVFAAAEAHGLQRVVYASSETVLGLPFDEPPAFAPIDESHPSRPETSYALSKVVGEAMAAQFARRTGTPHVGLRISNIMEPDDYQAFPGYWEDAALRRWNLWGYVDVRDVARACERALAATVSGAEVCIIAAGGHGHEPRQRRAHDRGLPDASRCSGTSRAARRSSRSTGRARSSATSRASPGGTSSRYPDPTTAAQRVAVFAGRVARSRDEAQGVEREEAQERAAHDVVDVDEARRCAGGSRSTPGDGRRARRATPPARPTPTGPPSARSARSRRCPGLGTCRRPRRVARRRPRRRRRGSRRARRRAAMTRLMNGVWSRRPFGWKTMMSPRE